MPPCKSKLPTQEQLVSAHELASRLKKTVPHEALTTELKLRMWVNSNRGKLLISPEAN
jgi:hypothetical protein